MHYTNWGDIPVRKRLYLGTVPVNKKQVTGTVPANKEYLTGKVPVNKEHLTGTLSIFLGNGEEMLLATSWSHWLKVRLGFQSAVSEAIKLSLWG